MLRTVHAVRYVLPFREGGSVPALVEADDLGHYVVKLRGASQGAKALVAEIVAGELARAVGLPVPEIVLVDLPRELAASEPDPEICLPLEASVGLNVGLDYLPGSITFDPLVTKLDAMAASRIVLLDAFVMNVDRTPRNPNLLSWHSKTWLIDHGASLYFHHGWSPDDPLDGATDPFAEVKDHVLLLRASSLPEAADHLGTAITDDVIANVVRSIPDDLLGPEQGFDDVASHRAAYVAWLRQRVQTIPAILEEAHRARALRV